MKDCNMGGGWFPAAGSVSCGIQLEDGCLLLKAFCGVYGRTDWPASESAFSIVQIRWGGVTGSHQGGASRVHQSNVDLGLAT